MNNYAVSLTYKNAYGGTTSTIVHVTASSESEARLIAENTIRFPVISFGSVTKE